MLLVRGFAAGRGPKGTGIAWHPVVWFGMLLALASVIAAVSVPAGTWGIGIVPAGGGIDLAVAGAFAAVLGGAAAQLGILMRPAAVMSLT